MKELTEDQVTQLKGKGLSDVEIQTIAEKKGLLLPQPKAISTEQLDTLRNSGLNDDEIQTIAQKKGYQLPQTQEVGGFQGFVQAVANPFLKVASSVGALLESNNPKNYNKIQNEGLDFGYFGKAKPVGAGFDVTKSVAYNTPAIRDAIGTGAEIGSYLVGGTGTAGAVKTGLKGVVTQAVKQEAITGAIGGGAIGFGDAIEQADKSASDVAYNTLFGAGTGLVLGGILGTVAPIVVKSKNAVRTLNNIDEINNTLQESNLKVFKPTPTQLKGFGKNDPIKTYTGLFGSDLPQVDKNNRFIKESVDEFANKVEEIYQPAAEAFNTILRNSPERVSLSTAEKATLSSIKNSDLTPLAKERAMAKAKDEFLSIRADAKSRGILSADDSIPVAYADNFKDAFWKNTKNFGSEDASISNIINKSAGFSFKDSIESVITDFNVQEYNRRLGELIVTRDFLRNLAGKQAGTGGTITRLATRLAGTVAGSAGGIPGSIAGAITGDMIARVMINPSLQPYRWLISRKLKSLPEAEVQRLTQEANAVIEKMFQKRMETLRLPAPGQTLAPKGKAPTPIPSTIELGSPSTIEAPAQSSKMTSTNPKTGTQYVKDVKTGKTEIINKSNSKPTPKSVDPLLQEAKKYKSAEEFVNKLDEIKNPSKNFEIIPNSYLKIPKKIYRGENGLVGLESGTGSGAEGFGLYTTTDKKVAEGYARLSNSGVVKEMSIKDIPKNPIYFRGPAEARDWATRIARQQFGMRLPEFNEKMGINKLVNMLGHDGLAFDLGNGVAYVKYPETGITKSQLTDIWEKANKKSRPLKDI